MAARALWMTGLTAVARWIFARGGRFVLEFHGVPRRPYKELKGPVRPQISARHLESTLAWLVRRFHLLTPRQLLETESSGVLLTFDDGLANNHDVVLPILRKYQAPAIFFVATQHLGGGGWLSFVDGAAAASWGDPASAPGAAARDLYDGMNEDMVASCAESGLVTIGAHSVSHPRLTTLGDDELRREIVESKDALENLSGGPVDLFAYPFGEADERVARAVADAGFRAAFVEGPLAHLPAHLAIPRVGIHRPQPWYLAAKLSGLYDRPLRGRPVAV